MGKEHPMRIAVISDIHANMAAFEAVLDDINDQRIGEILCLGDNIGYGPDPEEVIRKMRELRIISIQGNHEYALVNPAYFNRLNPDPRRSLELTLDMLSKESLAFIRSLDQVTARHDARLVHGCPPRSQTAYLFFPSPLMLDKIFGSFPEKICFYGHTHTLNFFEEGLAPEKGIDIVPGTRRLDPSRRYIINPGSVGQPRDNINNHAKYLIWDQEDQTITHRTVSYDVLRTVNRLSRLQFPAYNAQRLLR